MNHDTPVYVWYALKKDLPWKMGWQYTTPSGDIISPKGVLKFRTPLLHKDAAPSIPTGMLRNATYPHGANHSSPITVPNKGMPRNRASLCILSLNFTSLLALIRILLFPCLKLFLPLVTGIEFLNFRHKESGKGINDGLWQFNLVWILTFFLASHSVLPQQQNLSGST